MDPILRVASQDEFVKVDLNRQYDYAVSIQEASLYPNVLRPDFRGTRLNLYFDDVVEGDKIARPADIDRLYQFALRWRETARQDLPRARLIIHCAAGVSRSAAVALMPLSLYYGSFREAARHLFGLAQYFRPNTHILHLIEERLLIGELFSLGMPGAIFEAVLEFQT